MGCGLAPRCAESCDTRAIKRRSVGWGEIFRDEHCVWGILRLPNFGSGEYRQYAQPDIAHVIRALCEELVAHPGKPVRVHGDGLLPSKCSALAFGDCGFGDLEKIRIGFRCVARADCGRVLPPSHATDATQQSRNSYLSKLSV
jgi:hypothetical protein